MDGSAALKLWGKVVIASLITFAVWVSCWYAIWLFALTVPPEDAARLGQVGDMFGAGGALFSGIAVAAVAIVLTFDMTERSKDLTHRENELLVNQQRLRPFVVPELKERDGFRISDAKRNTSGTLSLTVTVNLDLRNHSADVALNVSTWASMTTLSKDFPPYILGLPLVQSASATGIELTGSLSDDEATRFLRDVRTNSLVLRIVCEYSSLNGSRWHSTSEVDLMAKEKSVRDLIDEALAADAGWGSQGGPGIAGGTIYPISGTVVKGSWKQEPVASTTIG